MEQEFLKPELDGPRFAEHSIPLELLKDLSALEEMIVAVAKWEYLQEYPNRKRVLRNFSSGLELRLSAVEEGSAIPAIVLAFSTLFPSHNATYFERARDQIIEAVASAADGRAPALPPQFLAYFDRVGRGLKDGESMSFARAAAPPARLTPSVRKRLIDSAQVHEWTEDVTLRGRVCEFDPARGSFELELRDGIKVKVPLHEQHKATVFELARHYPANDYIMVQAIAIKDRTSKLKSIQNVEQITELDPLDVALRLDEFAQYKSGWLDGKGLAFEKAKLERLVTYFDRYYPDELPLPHLYPTAEGAILAEWTMDGWEISLEIDLTSLKADYQAFNVETGDAQETAIELNNDNGWGLLHHQLKQIERAQA